MDPHQEIAIRRIADTILSLPQSESLAYREALVTAPILVQRESDPILFLSCTGGDAFLAAQRLCRYWQERKLIFGGRAFLPMDLTGHGALTVDDITVVRHGCVAELPPHGTTSCSVLVFDRSRSPSENNMAIQQRQESGGSMYLTTIFYHLQHLMSNPLSQTQGFFLLVRALSELMSGDQIEQNATILLVGRLLQVFPIRIKAVHIMAIISLPPGSGSIIPMIEMNLLALKRSWENVLQMEAQVNAVTTESAARAQLERQGFSGIGIPTTMGGTWSYEYDFGQRLLSQLAAERVFSEGSLPIPNQQQPTVSPAVATNRAPLSPQLPPMAVSPRLAAASVSASSHLSSSGVSDSADMREGGLRSLGEAIQCLPEEKRSAYCEALEECPDLVKSESDPVRFLRYEGYDPWAAAQRLTNYWTWRKRIFRERAFLPITMTGNGALSPEDIVSVKMGYFTILPNDKDGRMVICYDPSRRVRHSKETRMRVGFYYWSVICENEMSRRDGYVGVVLLGTSGFGPSSLDGAIRECVEMVLQSFPTHVKNMHLVQCLGRKTLLQMLLPLLNFVMGRIMENRAVTHVADTAEEMMTELGKFGLGSAGIPQSAGGSWTYDKSYMWQLERCITECRRFRARLSSRPTGIPDPIPSSSVAGAEYGIESLMECLGSFPDQEKVSLTRAWANHPTLVQAESCPQYFVRCQKFDLVAAARQLALYWTFRCALFGEKAFLPMTQTGEGALSRTDLTVLSSNCLSLLPTRRDEPAILCFDVSKQGRAEPTQILRLLFYLLHVASENAASQTLKGVSIIVTGLLDVFKAKASIDFQPVFDALPVIISTVHFTHLYGDETTTRVTLDEAVATIRQRFGSVGNEKAMVQVGRTKDELYEQLAPYGIRREVLPKSIGGTFGYDRFVQWQELRTRFEWGLPAGANDLEAVDSYDFSGVRPLSELDEDGRKERKRRMNVVHSRRKREREKIEIQVLQEQCAELKEDNRVLIEEKRRLSELIEQSGNLLAGLVSGSHGAQRQQEAKADGS